MGIVLHVNDQKQALMRIRLNRTNAAVRATALQHSTMRFSKLCKF